MGRGVEIGVASLGLVLGLASGSFAQSLRPDPLTRIALFGAAFAGDEAKPAPGGVTAMAFLPGRGVVSWNIAGKTPEEAREAQIEAMGLADAQAVQREIDAAHAAPSPAAQPPATRMALAAAPRSAFSEVGARGAGRAGVLIPLEKKARGRLSDAFGVHDGAQMQAKPRVYAFAAVSGQAMGYNLTADDDGWKSAGLTTDRGGFYGQRQAGVAWRAGQTQAALSWAQEKTRMQIMGMDSVKDQRVMLTLNMTPQAVAGLFTPKP